MVLAPVPPLCADCGVALEHVERRSIYFARPLCETCYQAETQRPKADAERWVLERMYAQPTAPTRPVRKGTVR